MDGLNELSWWSSDGGSSEPDLTGISAFLCSAVSDYSVLNHSAGCNNAAASV